MRREKALSLSYINKLKKFSKFLTTSSVTVKLLISPIFFYLYTVKFLPLSDTVKDSLHIDPAETLGAELFVGDASGLRCVDI